MSLLGYRRGSSARDIEELKALPKLSADERKLIEDMELVILVRQGRAADMKSLLSRYPNGKGRSAIVKKALAQAKFHSTEPGYISFEKLKVDLNPNRFANTLKRKLNSLDVLEKEYMSVVGYGDGEYALKSLQRLSTLYREISKEISQTEEAKKELESFYKPLYEKGVKMLSTCLEKAQEFKIAGPGLDACRLDLAREKAELAPLNNVRVPDPQWIPSDNEQHDRNLMKVTARAFQRKNIGEFLLGADLLEKASPAMTPRESAYLMNMAALIDWRQGEGSSAFQSWKKAADESQSDLSNVRIAAQKNLAAAELQVGNIDGAMDILNSLNDSDGDVAQMKTLIQNARNGGNKK
jgi:hypothetical protein